MSKADKMFEELGYTEKEETKNTMTILVYKNLERFTMISFSEKYKVVLKTEGIHPKAINKKCEELGWL